MGGGVSVSLCIFGVVRNYLLCYLMYLWLNPVVFLVLPCRGWQLLPGAGGCSSLFPAPPSRVWLSPWRSPVPWHCHSLFIPRISPPWQQLLLTGFGGSSSFPGIPAGSGSEGEAQPQQELWKARECSESCQPHWESNLKQNLPLQ